MNYLMNNPSLYLNVGADALRSSAKQDNFIVSSETRGCLGNNVPPHGDFPVSEVISVFQTGHFHGIRPALLKTYFNDNVKDLRNDS